MKIDALFVNGRITTMDEQRPTATTLGVFGGLVVGFDEELDGVRAEVVHDLEGATVVPGFHDAHFHLSAFGHEQQQCDVSPAVAPTSAVLHDRIRRFASDLPTDAWVLAFGYDDSKLDRVPDRESLEVAAGGRPVWMIHASMHAGTLSTAAIRRLGYSDIQELPDVPGGWVERDEQGTPTGRIAERALQLVYAVLRPAPFEDHVEALALGSEAALAMGLTSITEPGIAGRLTGNGPADMAGYQAALERGRLRLRVTVMPEIAALHHLPVAGGEDPPGQLGLDLGLRSGLGDDRLRIGGVKVFADGALTARTAALRDPYHDRPEERGLFLDDPAELRDLILQAHLAGWQVATHAIGDAAIDLVLDAYETAEQVRSRPGVRHRMEHGGVMHDEQLERLVRLGVVPVPQGRFLSELGDAYVTALGPERSRVLYRQRSLLAAGIELPGSSDCPVVDGAPLLGIQALMTRELPDGSVLNPEERLTASQALRAYTYGSAYADGQERRKGSLRAGKLADFVVLSDDLLHAEPDAIGDIAVEATVVGGEVAFGAKNLSTC